ncbi:MAG: TonB-dependent receptor [Pseudomonadota bacterium]
MASAYAGLTPLLAAAQPSSDSVNALALEEVIVSATRRDTNLQETPLTIQAITESELLEIGATDLDDIVGLVPGLIKTGTDYTIRGLRSNLGDRSGTISTTSRYLDETPIEHNFRIYDIARVEVLKGPQGTLYGAGAMGGTIRLVTNKPDSQALYSRVDVDYSSTSKSSGDNYELNGVVNVPLIEDQLALRAVAYQHDYAGFTDDLRLGIDDFDDEKVTGGRAALTWEVSDTVNLTGSYVREDVKRGGEPYEQAGLNELETERYLDQDFKETWEVANLTLNWDLQWANLTATYAYTERDRDAGFDATRFINTSFGLPEPPNGGFASALQLEDTNAEFDVAEIRLVSNTNGNWDWVVGAFYQDINGTSDSSIFLTEVDPDNPALGFRVGDLDGFEDRDQLADQRVIKLTEREIAGFGELTYHFNEKLSTTGGIRYLDVEQENQFYIVSTVLGYPAGTSDPLAPISVNHSDYYTKFRLAYHVNDDVLMYFLRSEGFRRGGFNVAAALGDAFGVPNIPPAFDSDEVTNWEMGLHSEWLDNRMLLNGALYYMDWTDIRVGALHPSGVNFTTNGPEANIYGLELEFSYRITENLDIAATAALTSAELSDETVDEGLAEIGVPYPDNLTLAPKGEDLPGIPKETYSLTANYTFPNLFADFDGYARFDGTYTSSSYNTYAQGQYSGGRVKMGSYYLANLRLGVNRNDWNISFYVKNLTDERADLFIDQSEFGPQQTLRNRPRTYGMNIMKTFE